MDGLCVLSRIFHNVIKSLTIWQSQSFLRGNFAVSIFDYFIRDGNSHQCSDYGKINALLTDLEQYSRSWNRVLSIMFKLFYKSAEHRVEKHERGWSLHSSECKIIWLSHSQSLSFIPSHLITSPISFLPSPLSAPSLTLPHSHSWESWNQRSRVPSELINSVSPSCQVVPKLPLHLPPYPSLTAFCLGRCPLHPHPPPTQSLSHPYPRLRYQQVLVPK
jgi:hypothetical protein